MSAPTLDLVDAKRTAEIIVQNRGAVYLDDEVMLARAFLHTLRAAEAWGEVEKRGWRVWRYAFEGLAEWRVSSDAKGVLVGYGPTPLAAVLAALDATDTKEGGNG